MKAFRDRLQAQIRIIRKHRALVAIVPQLRKCLKFETVWGY